MPGGLFGRLVLLGVAALAGAILAPVAIGGNFIVLYTQQSIGAGAAAAIARAGGSVVASYPQIGVVVARSDSPSFRQDVLSDSRVWGAASTSGLGVQVEDAVLEANGPPLGGLPNFPADDAAEPLFPLQWDMRQIHTPEAHSITGGSPEVLVGDIDTGLDFTHPDLAPNYDATNSADCSSGAPAPLLPGNDVFGHGTHTAGTIAAAQNGIGIVGVAPKVRIAGIKSSNNDGFFFPEMVVCSFMWAGSHGIDVTNNSYFADPWYFNCKNDPEQRAIWIAEQRAIKFAMSRGVTVVAAAGNFADDLAHPTRDIISPDTGPGIPRDVTNACAVIPVEVPGVIGVSADGNLGIKSFYSSYGSGVVQLTAPGGDSILQRTPEAPNGRVLSTIPGGGYAYAQGTSMATPHVTGVAALIESRYGPLARGRVKAMLTQTADPVACPDAATLALYSPFPQFSNGEPQACQGGAGYNSWYGHGQVNALSAITHGT
jgi:lantibiotic leader peptide-processing serine protease